MNNLVKCAISANRQQQYRLIVAASAANSTSTRKISIGSSVSTALAVKSSTTSSLSLPQPSLSSRFRSIGDTDTTRMSQHEVILKKNLNNLIKLSRQFEANLNGISHTQKLIAKELEKDNPKISLTEIKELLYMSKTDEDLDILARALNRYLLNNNEQKNNNERVTDDLSRTFLELLYLLKKTSKAIDYFHDPSLRRLFRSHRTLEVLYKIVAEADLYDEFIGVLTKASPRYYKRTPQSDNNNNKNSSTESSSTSGGNKPARSGDPFSVPLSHMDIISKFLLKQNSSHSLNAFRELIYRTERSGVEVVPFFKLRCILLALQQNNPSIAYDLMKKKIVEKDLTMQTNLRAMIFSKMNRQDECLQVIKKMFIFGNKIFPFTLKMLRQDTEKGQIATNEFKAEIDSYLKRAYLDERVLEDEDLPDLLMGPFMLNTDTFVTSVLEKDLESSSDELSALPPKDFDHDEQSSSKSNQFRRKSNKTAAAAS